MAGQPITCGQHTTRKDEVQRPTVRVRDVIPALSKDVVNVDILGVACVGHAMVADKRDVDNVGEVPCL